MKKNRSASVKITNTQNQNFDISTDIDGVTRLDRLVLVDQKTSNDWELRIEDGKIILEPYDISDKRNLKLISILKKWWQIWK